MQCKLFFNWWLITRGLSKKCLQQKSIAVCFHNCGESVLWRSKKPLVETETDCFWLHNIDFMAPQRNNNYKISECDIPWIFQAKFNSISCKKRRIIIPQIWPNVVFYSRERRIRRNLKKWNSLIYWVPYLWCLGNIYSKHCWVVAMTFEAKNWVLFWNTPNFYSHGFGVQ